MDSYGGEHRPSLLDPSLLDDATPLAAARRETRVALASVQELTERVQELSKELAEARGIAKMCGHLLETTLRQFTRCAGTLEAVPANPEAASTEAQGGAEGAAASDSKGGDGSAASAAEGKGGEGTEAEAAAPLPAGWEEKHGDNGVYYFHSTWYRTQWERPTKPGTFWPEGISRDDPATVRLYHAIDSFACFPFNSEVLQFLVAAHAKAGLWVACIYYIDFLIHYDPSTRWSLIKASCCRRLGMFEWALDVYENSVLAEDPYCAEALRYSLAIRQDLDLDVGDLPQRVSALDGDGGGGGEPADEREPEESSAAGGGEGSGDAAAVVAAADPPAAPRGAESTGQVEGGDGADGTDADVGGGDGANADDDDEGYDNDAFETEVEEGANA